MPLTKLSRKYHLLKRDKDGTNVMKLEHQASSKIAQVIQLENFVGPLINNGYKEQESVIPETPSSSSEEESSQLLDARQLSTIQAGKSHDSSELKTSFDLQGCTNHEAHETASSRNVRQADTYIETTRDKITLRRPKKEQIKCKNINSDVPYNIQLTQTSSIPFLDCEHWNRFESTHIDHLAQSEGDNVSIFTEDMSIIFPSPQNITHSPESAENETYHSAEEEIKKECPLEGNNNKVLGIKVVNPVKPKNTPKGGEMIKSLAPPRIHHKMLFSTEKKKKSDISLEHIESLNKHSNVLVIGSDEDDESTLYRLNGSDARRTHFARLPLPLPCRSLKEKRVSSNKKYPRRSILGRNEVILLTSDSDSSSDDDICTNRSKCCWNKHILKLAPLPKTPNHCHRKINVDTMIGPKDYNCLSTPVAATNGLSVSRIENIENWIKLSPFAYSNAAFKPCPMENRKDIWLSKYENNMAGGSKTNAVFSNAGSKPLSDNDMTCSLNTSYGTSKKYFQQSNNENNDLDYSIQMICSEEANEFPKNEINTKNIIEELFSEPEDNSNRKNDNPSNTLEEAPMRQPDMRLNGSKSTINNMANGSDKELKETYKADELQHSHHQKNQNYCDAYMPESIDCQEQYIYSNSNLEVVPPFTPRSPPFSHAKIYNEFVKKADLHVDNECQVSFSGSDGNDSISHPRIVVGLQVSMDDDKDISANICNPKSTNDIENDDCVINDKSAQGEMEGALIDMPSLNLSHNSRKMESLSSINTEIDELTEDLVLHLSIESKALNRDIAPTNQVEKEKCKDENTNFSKYSPPNSYCKKPKNIFGNYWSLSDSNTEDSTQESQEGRISPVFSLAKDDPLYTLKNQQDFSNSIFDQTKHTDSNEPSRTISVTKDIVTKKNIPKLTQQTSHPPAFSFDEIDAKHYNQILIDKTPFCKNREIKESVDNRFSNQTIYEAPTDDYYPFAPPYADHLHNINTQTTSEIDTINESNETNDMIKFIKPGNKNTQRNKIHGLMNLKGVKTLQSPVAPKSTLVEKIGPNLSIFHSTHNKKMTFLSSLSLSEANERYIHC